MSDLMDWAATTGLHTDLLDVLEGLADACRQISGVLRTASQKQLSGLAGTTNVQGEAQKPLDILSNEIVLSICRGFPQLALAVSEEEEQAIPISAGGRYGVIFDPLDGSSNLDVNVTVGSIFSVVSAKRVEDLLPGDQVQHIAGFASYGPSTNLVLALSGKAAMFALGVDGQWHLVKSDLAVPEDYAELAINPARQTSWDPVIARFVADAFTGDGQRYNARWVASLVSEAERILSRGGVFLYPADKPTPEGRGRLRLLYEARPIAAIMEAAGGLATTGRMPILAVNASAIHDRVPLIFGSRAQVEQIAAGYLDA